MTPPSLPPQIPPSQAAALALRHALANPYSQTYSSHYAQAYMQQYNNGMPSTNAQGYTMSSTYDPTANVNNSQSQSYTQPTAGPSFFRPQNDQNIGGFKMQSFGPANSTWYQPGNNRCSYKNCTFTGSAKSVETHRMDRHLIYPPGWDKRKKGWDADPSLKGKPIPIQGTKLILDTPEAIDAWIEERKKRWPSSALVAEKKRKFEEASARGELSVESLGLFSKKKRKMQDSSESNERNRARNGRGIGRGRGNDWTPRGPSDAGWRGRNARNGIIESSSGLRGEEDSLPPKPTTNEVLPPEQTQKPVDREDNTAGSSSDSDSEPEVQSSKPPPIPEQQKTEAETATTVPTRPNSRSIPQRRQPQPKKPPHNPFAPKTSLLQNLLLPEIRMTVSNLSQAIRFIVDNNFFDGVELKPGEAAANPIQVVGSETNQETPSDS
ncbi:hypothetical protein DFJ43DRAFT_988786 [Lentinula guzmanii]|uniref:FMR1-interacting protein 1 conserved domain-containing protein n=1 Tax=Lentinula guzmanii TaxID=2804957 RepID=A0AA38JX04_9AGAR|nr:hypothetical protein DFJ43DRAFT_988786 [Lentinula guzmanii]